MNKCRLFIFLSDGHIQHQHCNLKWRDSLQISGSIHKIFFLFLHENICCEYSLEMPWWGTSNEYPQRMFLWRNKKNISTFGRKNVLSRAMSKGDHSDLTVSLPKAAILDGKIFAAYFEKGFKQQTAHYFLLEWPPFEKEGKTFSLECCLFNVHLKWTASNKKVPKYVCKQPSPCSDCVDVKFEQGLGSSPVGLKTQISWKTN